MPSVDLRTHDVDAVYSAGDSILAQGRIWVAATAAQKGSAVDYTNPPPASDWIDVGGNILWLENNTARFVWAKIGSGDLYVMFGAKSDTSDVSVNPNTAAGSAQWAIANGLVPHEFQQDLATLGYYGTGTRVYLNNLLHTGLAAGDQTQTPTGATDANWEVAAAPGGGSGSGKWNATHTHPTSHSAAICVIKNSPVKLTIDSTSVESVAGTCDIRYKINGTDIGQGVSAVSTTPQTIARTSANVINIGDTLTYEFENDVGMSYACIGINMTETA